MNLHKKYHPKEKECHNVAMTEYRTQQIIKIGVIFTY